MMPQMRLTSSDISANAPTTKTSTPPVVPLESGGHRPVGARRVAVELIDPRRALEAAPRDPRLPCCDRWRVPLVVVPLVLTSITPPGRSPFGPSQVAKLISGPDLVGVEHFFRSIRDYLQDLSCLGVLAFFWL